MNNYINKAKELLLKEPLALREFLDSVYVYCEEREDPNKAEIRQCMEELNNLLEPLPFMQKDAIGCACMALCCESEYAAFTDGFQKGAALILSLLST